MKSPRILIIEEDAPSGRELQSALVRQGFSVPKVLEQTTGALAVILDLTPDLVLLDLPAGRSKGALDLARQVQNKLDTPVLFLADEGDDLSLNRGGAPWPVGFLLKPVSEEDLGTAIRHALRHAERHASNRQEILMVVQTLRSLEQGVLATDLAGNVAFLNRAAEELLGITPEQAMGQPLAEVYKAVASEDGQSGARRRATLQRPSGDAVQIEDTTAAIEKDDGSLCGMVTVFRQVSLTDEEGTLISEGDERLISIARSIADPLFTLDVAGRITWLNAEAASQYAMPREEIPGRDFWSDYPPAMREQMEPQFEKVLMEARPVDFELHRPESETWHHLHAYPFAGGLLLIMRDITRQKMEEEQGKRMERLEGLGFLARGFAHDFNNLLTVLMGNLSEARQHANGNAELGEELDQAKQVTQRAEDLVQQIMTFAEGATPIKERIRPAQIIEDLMAERQQLSPHFAYQLVQDDPEVEIEADPRQIRRLFYNLFLNAEQALQDKGGIFIHLRSEPEEDSGISYLVCEVTDSGSGMEEHILVQAFDPFFTTRAEANATGLGLTVCETIARAHDGFIRLKSRPGQGTVASAFLPLSRQPEVAPQESLPATPVFSSAPVADRNWGLEFEPAGNETMESGQDPLVSYQGRILILEDEALIRRLMRATLTRAGFDVEETEEGKRTIEVYQEALNAGNPHDILIMDLTIENGMGGVETMGRIREINPSVKAIVSSGYSDAPAMADPQSFGFSAVLPKPYQPDQLVDLVAGLMKESAETRG